MTAVLGEMLPMAIGITISPIPIIAIILMLLTPRAGGTSLGFMLGWLVGIVLATGLFTFAVGAAQDASSSGSSPVKGIVLLVLAVFMLVLAANNWRKRPKQGQTAELPKWMAAIDKFTFGKAAAMGFLLSAINPKNLMMAAGGGAVIGSGLAGQVDSELICILVFTVIAGASVYLPVIVYLSAKQRMAGPLKSLKAWLQQNNAEVMAIVLLLIGVVLLGKGIAAF